jgi:NADH:ubiquinone oxidoreductase subunit F (NADH-binding)
MTTATLTARLLGGPPLGPRPAGVDVEAVVAAAGLVGRGGGGFPTARKLAAVRGRRRAPVLVANASEGEPLSAKDAALLTRAPHVVLEGIVLAARSVRAREAYLCLHAGSPAVPVVRDALLRHDLAGVSVRLTPVPDRYVASEESALVQLLSGGPALPTSRPPRPAERGVRGAPTLVLNAETLANVALAVHCGPERYRAVGDPAEPGTLLVTVAGAVPAPGVVELPTGTPAGVALSAAGATDVGAGPRGIGPGGGPGGFGSGGVGAVLTGGYGGAWLPGDVVRNAPLTHAGLRAAGGVLGPGILAVLPPHACGPAETAAIARYLAGQSAGQCGPCVFGLPAVAGALEAAVAGGPHAASALAAVRRWTATLPGRGACRHPDGAARLVASALRVFAADLSRHVSGRPCGGYHGPRYLEVPR